MLSKLRRALGPGLLEGRSALRLLLPADSFVELEGADEAIHRAESAVRRGAWEEAWGPARVALHTTNRAFLPGENGTWIDETRRHLEEVRLRAHECVARTGFGPGGPELDAALRSGHALVRLAPLRESGYRLLMRAHKAERNLADALAVYDLLRRRLHDELGIAPDTLTQALHRELLG